MAFTVGDLAGDPQRIARAVRLRRVPGKLLVREVRVVLDGTGWLHSEDPARAFAARQLCAPDRGLNGGREVHVVGLPSAAVVGAVAGLDQISRLQIGAGGVGVPLGARVLQVPILPTDAST